MGSIMKNKFLVILSLFHFSLHSVEVNNLVVPNGFKASLFANNLDAPRQIAEGDKGYIFVGSKKGIVYALKDNDKNGQIDDVKIIFDGLNDSSGVAYSNGSLFIAEIDKVWRVDNIEDNLDSIIELENKAIAEIKDAINANPDNIASIIIEPIQGEGGDNHFRCEFMQALRDIADENDIILIYDEVQTGVGVTGKMWAHQHFSTGVCTSNCNCGDGLSAKPDIISFGKKTQVCGVAASTRFDEVEGNVFRESSRINSTWGGSLVDMVRLTIYLELIEKENLVDKAAQTGLFLQQSLHNLQNEFPTLVSNARGKGLYCAFDLPSSEDRDKLANLLLDEGSILLGSGNYSIRFRPHLNVTEDDINFGMDCFRRALNKLS